MHKRLLFVDDEPVLRELYLTLGQALGHGHEVHTAASGPQALKLLSESRFDVVVSDLAMPEMDGIEFLNEVVQEFPESARIVVSGFADRLKIAECLTIGHRFFSKPLNFKVLSALLKRICKYSYLVSDERIRRMVCGNAALPTPPETYLRLSDILNSPYADMDEVGKVVQEDPGLSTKLLHIVNSAQFGISRQIVTPSEAVQILGIEVLKALMLGVKAFSFYDENPFVKTTFKDLWNHSLQVAVGARKLAVAEKLSPEACEECFLAGLLHDIGKLILAANAEGQYKLVLDLSTKAALPLHQAEIGIFTCTHAQIGAYLLALWGVPDSVIRAVELHHSLDRAKVTGFDALLAVHVSQNLLQPIRKKQLDMPILRKLGLEDRIPVWEEALRSES
jgi:putative nucleotidyltransferase with HDIG domain